MDFSEWFSRERKPGEMASYETDVITDNLAVFEQSIMDVLSKRGYEFTGNVDVTTYWHLDKRKATIRLEAMTLEQGVEA